MGYPSGGKRLEYIQSTGTQYIDTGFKPNQDTRVVADMQIVTLDSSIDGNSFWGARTTNKSLAYGFSYNISRDKIQQFFVNASVYSTTPSSFYERQTWETNKNVLSGKDVSNTMTFANFQCAYNLYLFAMNQKDSAIFFSRVKMYSCQVYDNGTLIRDCVPWEMADGSVGLWDTVNDTFYGSAGSGSFTAGPEVVVEVETEHSTVINGTVYKLETGTVMIGGTVYEVENGRVMVDGVVYDVPFGAEAEEQEMVVLWLHWYHPHGSRIVVNGVTYTEAEGDQFLAVPKGTVVEVWDYATYFDLITGDWFYQSDGGNPFYITVDHGISLIMDSGMGDDEVIMDQYDGDVGTYPLSCEDTSNQSSSFHYEVRIEGNSYSSEDSIVDLYLKAGTLVRVSNTSGAKRSIRKDGVVVAEPSVDATYEFAMPQGYVLIRSYTDYISIDEY